MDLDGFEKIPGLGSVSLSSDETSDAIQYIDAAWYGTLSRRARWMDLVGDFGGNELFVLEGVYLVL